MLWVENIYSMFVTYLIASISLFLYSFTQVDANLTISRYGILQILQKAFQSIGYNQRSLSTILYLSILVIFFLLYVWMLALIRQHKITVRSFWQIIGATTVLLIFSYPAFSYDMFNYLFTAKTVLVYHQNPYAVIPLQFSEIDPWTNFMRWTHLPSAYTPFWILLSLPAYIFSFGKLVFALWGIKAIVAVSHIATIIGIGKILKKVEPDNELLGMAIYALNPLILIENLVSSHNDVVMMALVVWAIYLYLGKNKFASWFVFSLSVATKLITITIAPVWFFINKKGFQWRIWMLIAVFFGFVAVIVQREVLPWYWVWVMPFVALLPSKKALTTLATGVSFGLLLRYTPFIYLGNYDPPVPTIRVILMWIPMLIAMFVVFKNTYATYAK